MLTLLLEVAILLKNDFICNTNITDNNTGRDTENSFPSRFNTASEDTEQKSACSHLCAFNPFQATGIHGRSALCSSSLPRHHILRERLLIQLPAISPHPPEDQPKSVFQAFLHGVFLQRGALITLQFFAQSRQVWRPVKHNIGSSEISPQEWKRVFFVGRGLAAFGLIDHFKGTTVTV